MIFWLNFFQVANGSVIDDSGPNSLVIGKAFGFMLFGNEGFMNPGVENLAVDGCKVTYELSGAAYSNAIERIYIRYDLNKANWRSAVYRPDYVNNVTLFEIYGEKGLRELSYDHAFANEDELRIGVAFLGLAVGPQSDIKIQLPKYITQDRYNHAYWDLTEQCPGTQAVY